MLIILASIFIGATTLFLSLVEKTTSKLFYLSGNRLSGDAPGRMKLFDRFLVERLMNMDSGDARASVENWMRTLLLIGFLILFASMELAIFMSATTPKPLQEFNAVKGGISKIYPR